jgi:homoserine dehydrogenase
VQRSVADYIRGVNADVLVEVTPLDPHDGEPAVTHCRHALRRGLHVVTANKGPLAFALRPLQALARRHRVLFRYEGAVMDGAPIFNLAALCLPGAKVLGFRGVLNSTTSHILSRMESGHSAASALLETQAAGVAEADPRHDLEGWDAAVKACALANALMGADLRPRDVRRRGIAGIGLAEVRRAVRAGRRVRLVAEGRRVGRQVHVSVAPRQIPLGDPLAASGPDAVLLLQTDLMGEIGVLERGATVDQTAYALLSDLLSVCRDMARPVAR